MNKWFVRHRLIQGLYILIDALAAEVVWFAFLYFRWMVLDKTVTGFDTFFAPAFDFSVTGSYHPFILFPLGCVVVYFFLGYYLQPGKQRVSSVIWSTLVGAIIIAVGAFLFIIIDDVTTIDIARYYKSVVVLVLFQFTIVLIPRLVLHAYVQKYFRRERVIIKIEKGMTEQDLYRRINSLFLSGKDIMIEPRLFDVFTGAARILHIDESPLIVISQPNMPDWELVVKRTFDTITSAIMLILLSPLFAIIAIAVKLDSPGPVIYRQERVGMWGRTFNILKFRSMYVGAETDGPRLSQADDARITRVGRILRKYRLDELPQFVNILRGEMAIVGPRPERPYFVEQIMEQAPYYCLLYKVGPGLTSWGPVKVGYTDTMEKMLRRLELDLYYLGHRSWWFDIKILGLTFLNIIFGKKF